SVDEIVGNVLKAITPRTRLLALTWVHSCTGVKMPVRAVADALKGVNSGRDPKDRVVLSIDGVHGFGIENTALSGLGCDFFSAGTHKWIFGPRGTGILWGRGELWNEVVPMIPAFARAGGPSGAALCTPGGFHSFEYR